MSLVGYPRRSKPVLFKINGSPLGCYPKKSTCFRQGVKWAFANWAFRRKNRSQPSSRWRFFFPQGLVEEKRLIMDIRGKAPFFTSSQTKKGDRFGSLQPQLKGMKESKRLFCLITFRRSSAKPANQWQFVKPIRDMILMSCECKCWKGAICQSLDIGGIARKVWERKRSTIILGRQRKDGWWKEVLLGLKENAEGFSCAGKDYLRYGTPLLC